MKKKVSSLIFLVFLSLIPFFSSVSIVSAATGCDATATPAPVITKGDSVCSSNSISGDNDYFLRNTIRWSPVTGATSYEIYYGKQGVANPDQAQTGLIGTTTSTSYNDERAAVLARPVYQGYAHDYSYWVKAISSTGHSAFSSTYVSIDESGRDGPQTCTRGDVHNTICAQTPPPLPGIEPQKCATADDIILRIEKPANALGELWNGGSIYPIEICFSTLFPGHTRPTNPHQCKSSLSNRILILNSPTRALASAGRVA